MCYHKNGFFPGLSEDQIETETAVHPFENRQSVAVTLEHAYDDWCAAQMAKKLGHEDDYALFMKRACNYQNLFNLEHNLMAPKDGNGDWIPNFDPKWSAGQGGRCYFAENNSWVYTWSVFHDIAGLGRLMGGDKAMERMLDRVFTESWNKADGTIPLKSDFLAKFPDATGLMGQFSMGNEPAFHIPYLYAYCGAPWKTQKRLRDIMDIWFTNLPTGICGDEDGGAMSSFYVFSAMGFYPVCPGSGQYILGTPIFDHVEMTLENGNQFTIEATGAGDGLRYIQSVTLNGSTWSKPYLNHSDIIGGGKLVLEMGKRPNKEWGVSERPYSASRNAKA